MKYTSIKPPLLPLVHGNVYMFCKRSAYISYWSCPPMGNNAFTFSFWNFFGKRPTNPRTIRCLYHHQMVGFLGNWHGPTLGNRVLVCGNLQMMMIWMQQLGSRGKSMNVCSGFWLESTNSCVCNCLEKLHPVRRRGYELLHALHFGENDILFWGHGSMIS